MSAATHTSPSKAPRTPQSTQVGPRLRLIAGLKNASKISSRGIWFAVIIVVLAFAVQLFLTTVIVEDAYRTDELEQQHLELEREHTAALEKTDAQESPQNLAQEATDLGMVPAGGSVFLNMDSATVVEGEGSVAPLEEVDPSLVPNAIVNPPVEAEDPQQNGESADQTPEPAVPSEFEMSSPSTR
ncbi:MAG: hypothetical protein ACTHXA_07565 [Gulosibacter sp.]|uniref:hypothetical protein n=1 Tax=Gulosibacter sp. TaxID=2817531 RepID=UPI003F900BAC